MEIDVLHKNNTIGINQIVYINQFFAIYYMLDYNLVYIFIVEDLYLALAFDDYMVNTKNIYNYQQFTTIIK